MASKRTSAVGRQDGQYTAPVAAEPDGGPIPTYNPIPVSVVKRSAAEWDDWYDLYDDEPDEDTWALLAAMEAVEAAWGRRKPWNPALHPRIPKGQPGAGRFVSMVSRLTTALEKHFEGFAPKGDPFAGFNREQLRRAAKKRGLTLVRGMPRDDIAKLLLDDLGKSLPDKSLPEEDTGPIRGSTRRLVNDVRQQLPRTLEEWRDLTSVRGTERKEREVDNKIRIAEGRERYYTKEIARLKANNGPEWQIKSNERTLADIQRELARLREQAAKEPPAPFKRTPNYPKDANGRAMVPPELERLERQVRRAGAAVAADIERAINNDSELAEMRTRRQAYFNIETDYTNPAYDSRLRLQSRMERKKLDFEIKKRELALTMQTLQELRSFNGRSHRNTRPIRRNEDKPFRNMNVARRDWAQRLATADNYFPDDWVETSDQVPLRVASSPRAFHMNLGSQHDGGEATDTLVAMNTDAGVRNVAYDGGFADYIDEVTVHEMGHRMEATIPGLTALEFAYVRSHTTNNNGEVEQPQRLKDLRPGSAYEDYEIAYPDKFTNPYTGKTYELSDPAANPWEVFQVGLQQTLGNASYRFGDVSLNHFTLGVLVTLHAPEGDQ